MTISVSNVTTTVGSIYTSVGNTAATFMSLCNYSGSTVTASVHVVPSGSSSSNATIVLSSLELTAGDTYQFYQGGEKLLLGPGDSIQVNASVSNAVTAVVSYTAI